MTARTKLSNKLISIFLCVVLVMGCLPLSVISANAASSNPIDRVADPSTMDDWKEFFLPDDGSISTENAGGVWTNKSVFTDGSAFNGTGIKIDDNDNFLVALSAIASNMTISGASSAPTDTMLILDLSSSMYPGRNPATVTTMLDALNDTLYELFKLNVNNRAGVVIYYGGGSIHEQSNANSSKLLLPLDRYTKGTDGKYLTTSVSSGKLQGIAVSSGVKNEDGDSVSASHSVPDIAGTYAQQGILKAMDQFLAADTVVPATASYQADTERLPVFIFMSDGEPTAATENFANSHNLPATMGNNQVANRNPNQTDFVTQLTASYAKEMVDAHYAETTPEFYTLSLGTSISLDVMDPANQNNININQYWQSLVNNGNVSFDTYSFAKGNWSNPTVKVPHTVYTTEITAGTSAKKVTFPSSTKQRMYVDQTFKAKDASGLAEVFKDIVTQISLKSRYFPTLVGNDTELSGYVSFEDKIGKYMNVTDIKGILIHDTLFSGADLSSNFVAGGGNLGTFDNPTDLGKELVSAVQARLGIKDEVEASTLIGLAYQYGQLSYTDDNNFSNYIAWYANAAGEFLGFWHEGITTMPDPKDPTLTDATRPAYIMKSYGYLGEVNEEQGVVESDMMYATVQVSESIASGEQTVEFAIPAALIPVITYEVTLDDKEKLENLVTKGAKEPIRLVYEVALDEEINEYNVKDVVSEEYLKANTNADGTVNFYTNQYETDNSTGYGKVNTYSYFRPSRQNDRYYYQENSLVYTDANGTLYTGDTKPTGQMYHAYTVYKKTGDGLTTEVEYHVLTAEALDTAIDIRNGNDINWYVPKGIVRRDYADFVKPKSNNATNTLTFSDAPFTDIYGHTVNDTNHSFVFGATLGNNGKLSLGTETGIKISKAVTTAITDVNATFGFKLTNTTDTNDNTLYPAYKISADGTKANTTVQFADGVATVSLKAGEILYIGGMTANDVIKVEEIVTTDYIVESVNGNADNSYINLTVSQNTFAEAKFVNTARGKGNLTIAKEIRHPFGTEYTIPADKSFEITVTLSGIGTQNTTFTAAQTNSEIKSITTDENGEFTIILKHNEQFEVSGLPEGTKATVVEKAPGKGFTAEYWDNRELGDGVVTVESDKTESVIVVNEYTTEKVEAVKIDVTGTKTLTGREWTDDDEFTFMLQKLDAIGTDLWTTIGTEKVLGSDTDKTFNFNNAFDNIEYTTVGTYYYRVIEESPKNNKLGGVSYDKTVHAFAVEVTDADMDGKLEIATVKAYRPETTQVTHPTADSWNVDVDFTNTYSAVGDTTVTVDIYKRVENLSESPDATLSGFTFGLYDAQNNLVITSKPTTDNGFTRLVIDNIKSDGTYNYTLKEIIPNDIPTGWTYSTEEIGITIVVTDDGNGNLSSVIYKDTDGATNATTSIVAEFTNKYNPTPAQLPIDFVKKELDGRAMNANEFTFAVKDSTGNTVLTGTNDANGKVTFNDTLKFDKVGIYFYDIMETTANGNGVTVDKNVYQATVKVVDKDGNLEASYVLVNPVGDRITFKNKYDAKDVTYSVEGDKKLSGKALLNEEFTFIMTEATDTNGTVVTNAKTYEAKNLTDGTFVFPTITYTEAGTYNYVVAEEASGDLFNGIKYDTTEYIVTITIKDNLEGKLVVDEVTYKIKGGNATEGIVFNNKYVANPTSAQIPGNKVLRGRILNDGEFSFELYSSDENWNEGVKLETVANTENGSFSFKSMTYDTVGRYYYLVKEVNGGQMINGVTYDNTVFRVLVEITDDLRGQLHASVLVVNENGIYQEGIIFNNIYEIYGKETVSLEGTKTLNGKEMNDGDFTFELYETGDDFKVKGTAVKTAENVNGKYDFNLEYDADDAGNTFYYVVKEENAGETIDGITYSNTEYHITVIAEDDGNGKIKTTTTIENDESLVNPDKLDFTNNYKTVKADITFDGTKVLTGNRELKADDFTFELYSTNEAFELGTTPIQTVKNKADGTFKFETIPLKEAKTYYFAVKENSQNPLGGVTYDTAVYNITVKVKDNLKGDLVVDETVIKKVKDETSKEVETIVFENSYKAKDTKVDFEGTKVLTGNRELKADDFTFEIYSTNEAFELGTTPIQTVKNKADGTFKFETIPLKEAKTYYFAVKENSQNPLGGVTYDTAVYNITVTVKDDGNGKLYVEDTVMKRVAATGTENATEILFKNSYNADSDTINLKGKKILEGRELAEGEFTFLLYTANSKFEINTIDALEAYNKADGTFIFDALTFNEAGTYYYVIVEDDTVDAERVTFDNTVYYVTVNVKDTGEGKLVAESELKNANSNDAVEEIVFKNKFTPKPDDINLDIGVDKRVENKGSETITAEGFEFILENAETGEKLNVTSDKDGKAKFTLLFTENDIDKTYIYKLTEVDGKIENVKYSTEEYVIKVTIILNAENELVTTVLKNDVETENVVAEFVNEYDYTPEPTTVPEPTDPTNPTDPTEPPATPDEPKPTEPSTPVTPQNPTSPQTGVDSNLALWFALLFVSGGIIITTNVLGKKKND